MFHTLEAIAEIYVYIFSIDAPYGWPIIPHLGSDGPKGWNRICSIRKRMQIMGFTAENF